MPDQHTFASWLAEHRGETLDDMSWKDFERCIKEVFRAGGWDVESTTYFDAGSDTLARRDGVTYAIQTKHRRNPETALDEGAVEQAERGRRNYGVARALIVTNALVTASASRLAEIHGVGVWDRFVLAGKMCGLKLLALDADSVRNCPACGLPMMVRDLRHGSVWSCEQRSGGCGMARPYCAPVLRLA